MSYRYQDDFREENFGKRTRQIRSMISRREIDPTRSNGDHVHALGREAEDGSFEEDDMDVMGSSGIIARPADDVHVETITLFVGGDAEHPVAVGQLDHTRRYVIRDVGMEPDETIVYTSKTIVKILKDGTVEIRNVDGTAVPLATKADVDAVNERVSAVENSLNALIEKYNTHTQPVDATPAAGPPAPASRATPSSSSATVAGTQVLKAQ